MKKLLAALVCMLMVACNTSPDKIAESLTSKANAVVSDLEAADGTAVDDCLAAIDACTVEDADAGVCDALDTQCNTLGDHLKEVRTPAVDCWKDVAACDENADTECDVEADSCDRMDDDLHVSRKPIVDCSAVVEDCLAAAADLATDAVPCEELQVKCKDVSELAIESEHARFHGDKGASDMCQRASEMVPENSYGRDSEDETDRNEADMEDGADAEGSHAAGDMDMNDGEDAEVEDVVDAADEETTDAP